MSGRKVLLVDDVITAGTAIRSSMQLLQAAGARVVGVVVCLDRQERTSEESHFSAVQVSWLFNTLHVILQLVHSLNPSFSFYISSNSFEVNALVYLMNN